MRPINESVAGILEEFGFGQNSNLLLEAVLATVLRHIAGQEDAESGSTVPIAKDAHFAILTSWRKFTWKDDDATLAGDQKLLGQKISRRFGSDTAHSKEINQKNFSDVIDHFQGLGLSVVSLTGSWLETGNAPGTDPFERSLFVSGDQEVVELSLLGVKSVGKKYNQDSVIYCGPETDGIVCLFGLDRKTGDYDVWAKWKNVKVDAAKTIAQQLQSQKRKLLGSTIKKWLGFKGKGGDYENAGASQVGGEGRGKIRLLGTPKTDPTASDKAFRFAESLIDGLLNIIEFQGREFRPIYEQEGQTPASIGVDLLNITPPGPYLQARNIRTTIQAAGLGHLATRAIHVDRINEAIKDIAKAVLKG